MSRSCKTFRWDDRRTSDQRIGSRKIPTLCKSGKESITGLAFIGFGVLVLAGNLASAAVQSSHFLGITADLVETPGPLNPHLFGKTKAARRTIPATDDVVSLLRQRVKEAAEMGTLFVFPSPSNIKEPIGSVKKAHKAAVERAKIKGHFRLYDLRHTFATRAVAAGVDLPNLSAILGHTSIQMTMRYVHPAAEQKRLAMDKYEKFRAEAIINAVQNSQSVPTKSHTQGLVH
jgi:hypothetical protein